MLGKFCCAPYDPVGLRDPSVYHMITNILVYSELAIKKLANIVPSYHQLWQVQPSRSSDDVYIYYLFPMASSLFTLYISVPLAHLGFLFHVTYANTYIE